MPRIARIALLSTALALGMAASANAVVHTFTTTLKSGNENPAVVSAGTGTARVDWDTVAHTMRVQGTFSGLTGNTTRNHIHCCVTGPGTNAGIATPLADFFTGSPLGTTSGTVDQTLDLTDAATYRVAFINDVVFGGGGTVAGAEAALLRGLLSGAAYFNVHTTFAPGGEVRGPLIVNGTLRDPDLVASTVTDGLDQPIAMAFIGTNDFLVTEKASGKVKRVTNGVVGATVLDLPVNNNSERGLLGITLHPNFPRNPGVYLYHTEVCSDTAPLPAPTACPGGNLDSANVLNTPLRGNSVDRYNWNGTALVFDRNIIKLHSYQNDLNDATNTAAAPLPRGAGNHNGGVVRFGPDKKLYIIIGDNGRRGNTQNIKVGLYAAGADDEFGGPAPDDVHMTGVILRLNDDGTTPSNNPFFRAGADMGTVGATTAAQVARNVQRIFAYGVRNSFGMTFDYKSGDLWNTENAGRAFDEINRVRPRSNNGWVQIMGPISRAAEFKSIEIAAGVNVRNAPNGLQQLRFPPAMLTGAPNLTRQALFRLPRSRYSDPQFSWKYVVPPGALGFVRGSALGRRYRGDLIVGSAVHRLATVAVPNPANDSVSNNLGHLYRFRLNEDRDRLRFSSPALRDRVADNLGRDDYTTEGDEILFGSNFRIVTDIQTGRDGALYLVSQDGLGIPSSGRIIKIVRPGAKPHFDDDDDDHDRGRGRDDDDDRDDRD